MKNKIKEKGFTRDIAEYLELEYSNERELIMLGRDMFFTRSLFTDPAISSKAFINCCKMIPKWNLNIQGKPFPLKKYLRIAKRYPDCLFEGYIITDSRPDERLEIDGIFIPRKNWRYKRLIKRLEKWLPDENNHHIRFTRLWWD